MNIRRNDNVLVIAGKEKGKTGRVDRQLVEDNRVVVEGVNLITRHIKARPGVRQSGRIQQEAPIHISNVALADPKDGSATRVGYKFLEDGRKVRIAKQSGEVIDV